MTDVPVFSGLRKPVSKKASFVYRGIEIVPSFDDERSRRIEADMRVIAARMGLPI